MSALMASRKAMLAIALTAALAAGGWYAWRAWERPDASAYVTVTTDRTSYREGDTVYVTIRNQGSRKVEIYVPGLCAVGNFATLVQVLDQDAWRGASIHAAYADSLPAFADVSDGRLDARAILASGASLELRLPGIRPHTTHPGEETMRAAFYAGDGRHLVYSNEFTVAP